MALATERQKIPEVLLIRGERIGDARGYFSETFRRSVLEDAGISADFVQDNQAGSVKRGTLRGLHFQAPPFAQAKLVRVIRGAIYDVAVDIRRGSATFGRWVGAELTEAGEQLFVPRGFAHGYCTLQSDTEVAYKCDAYYEPASEGGLLFSDPALGIDWPVSASDAVVSEKDSRLPTLAELASPFE